MLTKLFKDTVDARIKSDPEFALALIEEQRVELDRLTAIETAALVIDKEAAPNHPWKAIEDLRKALAAKDKENTAEAKKHTLACYLWFDVDGCTCKAAKDERYRVTTDEKGEGS